jgi:hypothetical protein
MRRRHTIIKLNTIMAALNMAEEDAHVFVESNRDFDKEGLREANKQYNRVRRAKEFLLQLLAEDGRSPTSKCPCGCEDEEEGCGKCPCGCEDEEDA